MSDQPYTALKAMHDAVYEKLKTDSRITTNYRIDTWDQGRFDLFNLPPTGIHARYQRLNIVPIEECQQFYTYQVEVVVWLLINIHDQSKQYEMAEMYLGRIKELMTDLPADWSVDGNATDVRMLRTEYAHDWTERRQSMLLCAAYYVITVDIAHG
jgi:hypothetical protein